MELGKAEEITSLLRTEIMNGTRQAGTKIASERDLSEELGASRMTVRRAIEVLEREGLVKRYPGRGTFVADTRERVLVERGREIHSYLEGALTKANEVREGDPFYDIEHLDSSSHVQFLEQPALVASDTEIAQQLNISTGALVLKHYRLQTTDTIPYRLIESYYPAELFGDILTTNIGDQSLFSWLFEHHHIRVSHVQEVLIARLATPQERQILRISASAPVVALNRTVWVRTGKPVEFARIIAVASLYTFTYEYDIPEWKEESKHK